MLVFKDGTRQLNKLIDATPVNALIKGIKKK
jgi:hypothetical protein